MSLLKAMPELVSTGERLDQDEDALGGLRDSSAILGDAAALRERMKDDGYLFLPGMLDRGEVLGARAEVLGRLAGAGYLDLAYPPEAAIASPTNRSAFLPELLCKDNRPLHRVLYDGPMIGFFEAFFGKAVLHYDFTWFRSIPPGRGTGSHCDVVYMGRGEREQLFTAWTPMGDVDFEEGGLMVLEGSNRHQKLKSTYGKMDVDSFCENKPNARSWGKSWGGGRGGALGGNPNQIRRSLGGRWLTGEYRAGDVLIFSMFTVHASLDNRSGRIRLSSDSRYQPMGAAVDERWVGANPAGHGAAGKRGKIC
jgi:hypothetical protein